jgi:integrase
MEWQGARMAAGAPEGLRIHDLRHHAATLTARMPGITTKELMARIGHASPRAALIYQHATEQRDREIAAYLDQAIEERPSP